MSDHSLIGVTGGITSALALDKLQDAHIGMYQAGFFPTMMIGLPAVAIAMALKSEKEHRSAV